MQKLNSFYKYTTFLLFMISLCFYGCSDEHVASQTIANNVTEKHSLSTQNKTKDTVNYKQYELYWTNQGKWNPISTEQGQHIYEVVSRKHDPFDGGDVPPFLCHFRCYSEKQDIYQIGICVDYGLVEYNENFFKLSENDALKLKTALNSLIQIDNKKYESGE